MRLKLIAYDLMAISKHKAIYTEETARKWSHNKCIIRVIQLGFGWTNYRLKEVLLFAPYELVMHKA